MNTPFAKEGTPQLGGNGDTEVQKQHTPLLVRGHRKAAELLDMSERRVQELVACNALPHHRVGRAVCFSPAELEAWIVAGCPIDPGAADEVRQATRRGGAA